ncbi:hypothetical protein [Hyphomicrobium sp.]|uniref:hypothetical protein n=1 Tax=Hyphomicrobium sp. TaxID=82 RepID=UPI003F6F1055
MVPADKLHRVSDHAWFAASQAALLAVMDQQTPRLKQAQLAVREARTKLPSSHAHRMLLECEPCRRKTDLNLTEHPAKN